MKYNFKKKHTLDKRIQESKHILNKYPDRIPIIVEKLKDSNLKDIDKSKYLVPKDMKIGQFIYVIRKRIKLNPEHALFITVNNRLPATGQLISCLYDECKDEDGFLYIVYSSENTFG
tara:strand:+ start:283 stop:633 length:351 start_codon:yes stop_codon:yes gene_type:complete